MKVKELQLDEKKIYEVAVIANTSSGKSTLINALVGRKILVSKNKPCTARNIKILDNDIAEGTIAHVLFENGEYSRIEDYSMELVDKYNTTGSEKIKEMILECDFVGIENLKKSVVIVDTPGPNNSLDEQHTVETDNYLKKFKNGLILYVINALQPCTYDDEQLLRKIYEKQKENNNLKILFVLNKIDEVDIEKEDPMEMVKDCFHYLKSIGFENIDLVSVSARAALCFKQAINGIELSRDEKRSFDDLFQNFSYIGYNFNSLAVLSDKIDSEHIVDVNGIKYSKSSLNTAIDNTGITQLVKLIEINMIDSLKYNPVKIKKITTKENTQKRRK